jgi:hypothetical protein
MSVSARPPIRLPLVPVELGAFLRGHRHAETPLPSDEKFVRCPFRERPVPLADCLECHDAGSLVAEGGAEYVHCYRLEGPYAAGCWRRPG